MKTLSLLQIALRGGIAAAAVALLATASVEAAAPKAFIFSAQVGNISGSAMIIDHPVFNGKSNLKPLLTQLWTSSYNPHPVGFRYNASTGRWLVENEDGSPMPAGANFNVLLAPGTKQLQCTPVNTFANRSFTVVQKNNPNALLLASHMVNPVKGMPGIDFEGYFGTYFEPGTGAPYSQRWTIYNEAGGGSPNPGPVAFNIADVTKLKFGGVASSFVFTTSAANISSYIATISNPLTDGEPGAVVFVQHLYKPGSSVYHNHPVAVYYDGGQWRIFNEDFAAMPENASFAVAVVPAATP
jgi:hypothetical protein